MYPKMFDNLKPSPLYQKNQLSYQAMNEIYKRSTTIPNFAKNVMLYLFDLSELLHCKRVMHVDRTEGTIGGLDDARFEAIRQMVEENAGTIFSNSLWNYCLNAMSYSISTRSQPE